MPEFKLPDPGEGLVEATIVQWKVAVGDTVKTNDIVVEVETAKSLVELPIPWDGTVTAILAPEGEEVEVGAPIITIDTGDGAGAGSAGDGAGAGSAGVDDGGAGDTSAEDVTDAATAASDDLVPTPPAGGGDEGGSGSGGSGGREAMLSGTARSRRQPPAAAVGVPRSPRRPRSRPVPRAGPRPRRRSASTPRTGAST
ncbi:biotin/lipoyl-containing protein [Ornithinimicrobium sp. W1665]|uniref:biotin/lipoyl-containing protein n=1 Tax=Ornithinimicrobium sp. W1665 TaxID=3416666 RepID=UPI003D6AB4CA